MKIIFSAAGQRAHDIMGLSPVAIGNRVLKVLGDFSLFVGWLVGLSWFLIICKVFFSV